MRDYYPILARAVLRLAINNAQARQELYDRARAILVAQLRKHDPQMSALGIIGERVTLETAIVEVEAQSLHKSRPQTLKNRLDALNELRGSRRAA